MKLYERACVTNNTNTIILHKSVQRTTPQTVYLKNGELAFIGESSRETVFFVFLPARLQGGYMRYPGGILSEAWRKI